MSGATFPESCATGEFTSMNAARLREIAAFLSGLADIAETREQAHSRTADEGPERSALGFDAFGPGASDCQPMFRTKPPLPDARLIREILRQRQLRARCFDGALFADPAWDMLLDLAAARVERQRVSIGSLCIAARVPTTTALRWIRQLVDAGLLQRTEDERDRRRALVSLSDEATDAMARYFTLLDARSVAVI